MAGSRYGESMNGIQRVERVAAYIEQNLEGDVTLERLSREAGVSRFHLQRSFKAALGVTPKQYAEACRLRSLKNSLRAGADVLESGFGAGFGSSSRIYERVNSRLGMTPAEYRRAGAASKKSRISITHATVETSLGLLTIGATDRGVCFVQFGESEAGLEEQLRREYPGALLSAVAKPWPAPLNAWIEALEQHLKGARPSLQLPLDIRATAFQMRVWRYLQSIPCGDTDRISGRRRSLHTESSPSRRARLRAESSGAGDSVPSRDPVERRGRRIQMGRRAEASAARGRT